MRDIFVRTGQSLAADDFRRSLLTILLTILLLGAWLAWFFFARVTLGKGGFSKAGGAIQPRVGWPGMIC